MEKSDHDHLGKLITYLTVIQAKTAIWIVSHARPEHVAAITWLNESSSASFYLVTVEAVKIDDSAAAPRFELIIEPSDETRKIGKTKEDLKERHILKMKWWQQLIERSRKVNNLHAGCNPTKRSYLVASAGLPGLNLNYDLTQKSCSPCLHINRKKEENKRIFDTLYSKRDEIEKAFGQPLNWERMDDKVASRISTYSDKAGYRTPETEWPQAQDEIIRAMDRLKKGLKPHLEQLKVGT